ncbi:hypothetical protein [Streptomyces regalis]|uniref:hypothetical protein n=1 Tax=Streptomyces regalis TaxID=68262 RepID=UPI000B2EFAE4|nr:hypothetical protein [Streptomyces regalis]
MTASDRRVALPAELEQVEGPWLETSRWRADRGLDQGQCPPRRWRAEEAIETGDC